MAIIMMSNMAGTFLRITALQRTCAQTLLSAAQGAGYLTLATYVFEG
jgi:hypothetical protein